MKAARALKLGTNVRLPFVLKMLSLLNKNVLLLAG